jgi:hypothetical protein
MPLKKLQHLLVFTTEEASTRLLSLVVQISIPEREPMTHTFKEVSVLLRPLGNIP